jgi:plasmid stabilization system protein ParE
MRRLPLSVSPRAEAEIQEAAQWYEGRAQGLGAAFLEIVEQALSAVEESPLRFPVVHGDTRRALLKRFPYGVFFRLRTDRIKVVAVMHLSRNPERWQKRR